MEWHQNLISFNCNQSTNLILDLVKEVEYSMNQGEQLPVQNEQEEKDLRKSDREKRSNDKNKYNDVKSIFFI